MLHFLDSVTETKSERSKTARTGEAVRFLIRLNVRAGTRSLGFIIYAPSCSVDMVLRHNCDLFLFSLWSSCDVWRRMLFLSLLWPLPCFCSCCTRCLLAVFIRSSVWGFGSLAQAESTARSFTASRWDVRWNLSVFLSLHCLCHWFSL